MQVLRADINAKRDKSFYLTRNGTTDCDYTLHLFRTAMSFVIKGKSVSTAPNTMILFNSNSLQRFHTDEAVMVNDYVCFNAPSDAVEGIPPDTPFPVLNTDYMHRLFSLLHDELQSETQTNDAVGSLLLKSLLSKAKEAYALYRQNNTASYQKIALSHIRNQISHAPEQNWNIQSMAKSCNLSPSRFQALYKQYFFCTPMADVIQARLEKSKFLLKTETETIARIAEKCGYNSAVHFINQFKKATGLTPSQYRRFVK